ncbi:ABC transporter substrate-binding protein [uncultured Modestobacter sp.]|uniref:ABC transporter substrate-binding protein n=1 Tax=uncultured Modestobacter sp. TaxID=380048 RepID=UPI0026018402|nr:ABC transporter substrate-binding protein [uncultured Modestobacter sp.]
MSFRSERTMTALAGSLAIALTLTACGGSDSESSAEPAPSSDTPVTVQAGFIPVIDVAALYLGDEQGFFADRGIDLEVQTGQGGAALVPPVVSGEYQFAFSNMVSVLTARARGLPLQIIASGSSSTGEDGQDVSMIRVPEESDIQSAADLAGRRVSVNTLNNLLQMLGDVAVDADGGNPDDVEYVELPFPDAVAALDGGEIDAMVTAEPFDTIAAGTGTRVISTPYLEMSADPLTTSVYFSSEQQLNEDPELFQAIVEAINESLEYAQAHPDEVRAQLSTFTQIDPAVIEQVTLPTYDPEIPEESVQTFIDTAKEFGIVEGTVSYDDLVWSGPEN